MSDRVSPHGSLPRRARPVKQQRVVAFAAAGFVLYAMASAGAGAVVLDAGSVGLAIVALGCALLPVWPGRVREAGMVAAAEDIGRPLVTLLSASLSLLLGAQLSAEVHPLLAELVTAMALPFLGALVLRLALRVPDVPVRLVRHMGSELVLRFLGLVALVLGVVAALPPIWFFGRALIAPHWLALAPPAFALACLVIATALRLFRRRLGSDARALSANLWATLGSVLGLLLVAGVLAFRFQLGAARGAEHATLALSAGLFALGHAWLVSPERAVVASRWARELFAVAISFAAAAALFVLAERAFPGDALSRLLLCALLLAGFALLLSMFRRVSRFVLAPHRGRLLDAIAEATREGLGALDHDDLGARVLKPLRRASLSPEAAPILYSMHPERELRLDAAGQPRSTPRALHPSVAQRLAQFPGEPIVRDDLAARLLRRPELRDLIAALDELDALCVVPLLWQGELEGALVVARGARRDPLTLEELGALESFARFVAASASVFLMAERANLRFAEASAERAELKARVDELVEERDALRTESVALRAGQSALAPQSEIVAYSPAMRALSMRLHKLAADDVTLLLVSEPGTPLVPLARLAHEASGRSEGPFVVAECADFAPGDSRGVPAPGDSRGHPAPGDSRGHPAPGDLASALFGSHRGPGWLELAGSGTLVLVDVPAMGPEVQRMLARALAEKRALRVASGSAYPVEARLIVTARRSLEQLMTAGVLTAELGRWLEPAATLVPPLRERREDIESLVLKALDQCARAWGRHVLGVAPDALRALIEHDWPGNLDELTLVVQRAVVEAQGTRITREDLPPLTRGASLPGSYLDQERDILRRALDQAGGSKTRAARSLGLKRSTLIEKLRRLGLEDPQGTEH
jgi:DNA-binding NtrC family response regulator